MVEVWEHQELIQDMHLLQNNFERSFQLKRVGEQNLANIMRERRTKGEFELVAIS
jgi:hypothetical protein